MRECARAFNRFDRPIEVRTESPREEERVAAGGGAREACVELVLSVHVQGLRGRDSPWKHWHNWIKGRDMTYLLTL